MINCLFVGLGGFIGAVCRYLIGLLPVQSESGFPYKTFLINVAGAFLIGCIATYAGKHPAVNPQLVLFLKVGICGGFTTFSTFAFETTDLFAWTLVIIILSLLIELAVGKLFDRAARRSRRMKGAKTENEA